MSIALITLAELKLNVYVTAGDTTHDADLNLKIYMASAILLKYIREDEVPDEWYSDDSPPELETPDDVKCATLLMASELFNNREASEADVLSPTVKLLLTKYFDPPLA